MELKQLKWIFNKALFLIRAYEGRELTEKDCEEIIGYAAKAYGDSKGNGYCKNILLDVVCALDGDERKRNRNGEAGKRWP